MPLSHFFLTKPLDMSPQNSVSSFELIKTNTVTIFLWKKTKLSLNLFTVKLLQGKKLLKFLNGIQMRFLLDTQLPEKVSTPMLTLKCRIFLSWLSIMIFPSSLKSWPGLKAALFAAMQIPWSNASLCFPTTLHIKKHLFMRSMIWISISPIIATTRITISYSWNEFWMLMSTNFLFRRNRMEQKNLFLLFRSFCLRFRKVA